ncbi:MAG: recombinase family protein [Caulobacterales bacterium]
MFTVFYTNAAGGDSQSPGEASALQAAGFVPTMTYEEKPGPNATMLRAGQRPAFAELLRSLERITVSQPKRLVVTRLERLGRDAEDVLVTIRALHKLGCEVIILQLGREDLTSATGKTVLSTLIAVAELGRANAAPRAAPAPATARPQTASGEEAILDLGPFGSRESGLLRRHEAA